MAAARPHRSGPVSRRRLLLASVLLFAMLCLVTWNWLWHSNAGLRFVLAHAPLQWQSAEGSLADGARIDGVTWRTDGLDVQVSSLRLIVQPAELWHRELRVRQLVLDGVDLLLAKSDHGSSVSAGGDLPLRLRIDALRVSRLHIDGAGRSFDVHKMRAAVQFAGARLHWQALVIEAAGWTSQGDGSYSLDGSTAWVLNAVVQADDARWRLHGRIAGDKTRATLQVDGKAPLPLHLEASAALGASGWQWRTSLRAQGLDTRAFGFDSDPLRLDLRASGTDLVAEVEGWIARAGLRVDVQPSRIAWRDQRLLFDPLSLGISGSVLRASGSLAFAAGAAHADLGWQLHGAVPGLAASARIAAQGRLEGDLAGWQLRGDGSVQVSALPLLRVAVRADGDRDGMRLHRLSLDSTRGCARLAAEIAWTPQAQARVQGSLDRIDPRLWSPAWAGQVSAALEVQAMREGDVWHYQGNLSQLRGRVRGRALRGEFHVRRSATGGYLRAVLGIGASHLQATAERQPGTGKQALWHWQLRAQSLQLADLHPDARGTLHGHIAGTDDWPREGELHGNDLRFPGLSLGGADLRIQAEVGERRHIDVRGEQIAFGALRFVRATLTGNGHRERLQWRLETVTGFGQAEAVGELRGGAQTLRVERLALDSTDFGRWSLREPGQLTFAPLRLAGTTCLDSEQGSALCASGAWPERLQIRGKDLDFGMLSSALAPQAAAFVVAGSFDAELMARYTGAAWQGSFEAQLGTGQLGLRSAHTSPVFTWRQARLHGERAGERLRFTLDAVTSTAGRAHAEIDTGVDAHAPLSGLVELDLHQLAWLELLSPDLARPSGRVHGRIDLGGTRAAPAVRGELRLSDFAAILPALGIRLHDSQAIAQGTDDGRFTLAARLNSGDGVLAIDGDGQLWPLPRFELAVTGTRVRAIDNPELYALISPALSVQGDPERIAVHGVLELPEARIALDRLHPQASTRSPDVHIVDPVEADAEAATLPLLLDLRLRPGTNVALKGFGLDGKLGGELQVSKMPGREALGVGGLNLSGQFRRYGKPLQIVHARLNYTGTPLADPALDIRAERKLDGQMVGVQVSGRASRAQTELIAEPALAQSEILSYLVLGRPLRAASAEEGARLDVEALALGAGGNLLAGQLGARIGLDNASVAESRVLGAHTLTVGKYLSPRLYLSYGVSLLGAGQILSLKYLLGAGVDVELESGLESRASLNWRSER